MSSSPGILGTHLPEMPDLGGAFPVASLWDDRCCMPCPSFISGLLSWSLGGDVRDKGCSFWSGWDSDTLRSVVFLFLGDENVEEGKLVIFLLLNCELDPHTSPKAWSWRVLIV